MNTPPESPILDTVVLPEKAPEFYQVPRRFNLPSVFVMTTLLAAVCGILKAFDAPAFLYVFIAVMTVVTCAAQIYAQRSPRLASTIGGALTFDLLSVVGISLEMQQPLRYFIATLVTALIFSTLAGALMGYIFGTLAAAVFMITDRLFSRRR